MTAQLKSQSNQTEGPIYIVRGLTKSLLGRPAIKQLQLISRINAVSEQELDPFSQFPNLFTGLGILQQEYNIQLEPGEQNHLRSLHPEELLSHSFRLSKKNSSGWNHWE